VAGAQGTVVGGIGRERLVEVRDDLVAQFASLGGR
jgi:hypothetical protein